jgi:hypothetical protein
MYSGYLHAGISTVRRWPSCLDAVCANMNAVYIVLQDLMTVRSELMPHIKRLAKRTSAAEAYRGFLEEEEVCSWP